ncbi:CoA transferase [Rhodothalassium salexigens]|uniref:CaiB/BaiF CoA transferase family protein n=1 Tax=Rhodothalassium salexigens TaxID=1086 RepID=UPI0019112F1E|nr:CaiB/BaiF CoA-transferase family protein [Rhodothalassium salexigens]MBK5921650.1 CoA transferase [Rhodothalassium salexigens]
MAGPLTGLTVLDLSRVLAGPWATQILGDLGADVIKVERPGGGDDTRGWGPPSVVHDDGEETAAYYLCANRSKRSVALDLGSAEGQRIARRLAARADVVVENFKAGTAAKWGLDYASLATGHPGLVYCSITGFGQTGPNRDKPGYDFMIQGMAGLMSVTGTPDSGPVRAGVAVADITTGLYATIAILAALRHRDATGQGQHIDMALFDTQLACLANQAQNYLVSGRSPELMGNTHPNIVPYQDFPTLDGRLIVAVGNDAQFARFAALLGQDGWAGDRRFARNADRVANRETLVPLIARAMAGETTGHWRALLDGAGIPNGPVNSIADALAEDQVAARGLRVSLADAAGRLVETLAQPMRFSATPPDYRRAPPRLGADTEAVLKALDADAPGS